MSVTPQSRTDTSTPLRLWPGVVAGALTVALRFAFPPLLQDGGAVGLLGGVAGGLAVVAWWLFFSRAAWLERVFVLAVMAGAVAATSLVAHPSIANGMVGLMLPMFAVPLMSIALVVAVAVTRHRSPATRRVIVVVAVMAAAASLTLVRTEGLSGSGESDLRWRWTPSPEERLLARMQALPRETPPVTAHAEAPADASTAPSPAAPNAAATESPSPSPAAPAAADAAGPPVVADAPTRSSWASDWPGFRGPARDSVVRGVRIDTNWSEHPPRELWRRAIGPGWSSFAVSGDLIYTQEQRGDDELVSCYRLSTGEPVWQHRDPVRFWESNGGAGPRATPTLHDGRVYTFGATGLVNALDARTGARVWSRDASRDTAVATPDWGFSSSPLVVGDVVVVAASGRLVAYDRASGDLRWLGPEGGGGYSSPHLLRFGGVDQVVLLRGSRTSSHAPADGALLWEDVRERSASIIQPGLADNGDLLITMGSDGLRRLAVSHDGEGWHVNERWTTRGLKPYFNDFVVHEGHAYGFDGSILSAINLESGDRVWKGGRYGHGQMMLLPDQDLLLVLSEDGELVLVAASPDKHTEIARTRAIEGKTWNHPVLVGDILLVRNGEEMAAFRLPAAQR